MDRLSPMRTGSALALTTGAIGLIGALAVFLFPDGMIGFVNAWFHGLDLTLIKSNKPWVLDEFIYGVCGVTVIGFLGGAVFAVFYNLVGSSSARDQEA
ncbi:MAG: hypothetical protein HY849_07880 [Nitrosomonadales bacterium]|nr:hypothetical protein [Nitrosomonadales bacterium]